MNNGQRDILGAYTNLQQHMYTSLYLKDTIISDSRTMLSSILAWLVSPRVLKIPLSEKQVQDNSELASTLKPINAGEPFLLL